MSFLVNLSGIERNGMERKYQIIIEEIRHQQKALLDKLEFAFATRPEEWRLLRSAILKAFGGSGITGFIQNLIEDEKIKKENK